MTKDKIKKVASILLLSYIIILGLISYYNLTEEVNYYKNLSMEYSKTLNSSLNTLDRSINLSNDLLDKLNYCKSELEKESEINKNLNNENERILILAKDNTQKVSDFDYLLYNFTIGKEYVLDEYDCTEFSEDLSKELKKIGFKAKTKLVNINCDEWTDDWDYLEEWSGLSYDRCKSSKGLHQIVQIDKFYIEATTGNIIMPKDYYKYNLG